MSVPLGARRHRRMSRRQRLQVGCRVFRSGLLRGSSAVSSTQSLFPGARRIADTLGGATCHVSISRLFFSCSCWILTGVGCLMEEVKAPHAWAWAWDLPQKVPPATFGSLGLTAWGSNAGAMDGDPRRLPASMRSPGAHSDRGFLAHIRAGLDSQRWERSMGKHKRKSRRDAAQDRGGASVRCKARARF